MVNIDLSGPHGNAFALMAIASDFARQMGYERKDIEALHQRMQADDYGHLIRVFYEEFKYVCHLTGLTVEEAEEYGIDDIVSH